LTIPTAPGRAGSKLSSAKKDADAWSDSTGTAVRDGVHVPDSVSTTVCEAARLWLTTCEALELEPATIRQYRNHIDLHIVPFIGALKLSQINAATLRNFEDKLIAGGRSAVMMRYVRRSLGTLLADAQERGRVARNVVRDLQGGRRRRRRSKEERRGNRLKVGADIPTPQEIRAFLQAAKGRWRPFFLVAVFTGLRASELRGLRWSDVDLNKSELHVQQRADQYRRIGPPKTDAGDRKVPLPADVVAALREWKLACPRQNGRLELVFPTRAGTVDYLQNIVTRGLWPTMRAAGIVVVKDGEPAPKYTGMHSMRHFFASWCINRKADGGLELPIKVVQDRMGHSTIQMTADRYGHLFPRADDNSELTAASQLLLG
jgi:integrase